MYLSNLVSASVFALVTSQAVAGSGIKFDFRYVDATSLSIVNGNAEAVLPADLTNNRQPYYGSPTMEKTVGVVKLAEGIRVSLNEFAATCNDLKADPNSQDQDGARGRPNGPVDSLPPCSEIQPRGRPIVVGVPPVRPACREVAEPEFKAECKSAKNLVANKLEQSVKSAAAVLLKPSFDSDGKIKIQIDRLHKLVKLMREAKPRRNIWLEGLARTASAGTRTLGVTTGGAQDARKFRDLIDGKEGSEEEGGQSGSVPAPDDFQAYGYINEFDLSLPVSCEANEPLCARPTIAYIPETKKLYIQAGLATNVEEGSFKRRPINVGVSIDISGSMEDKDNTSKNRLEWAKDAVNATLGNLIDGQDYITVSTFESTAKQIWPIEGQEPRPINAADRRQITRLVGALKTAGSTALNAGLELGYKLLADAKAKIPAATSNNRRYEHRLIMITDANLNIDKDQSRAVVIAQRHARNSQLNLSVIGVGLNFYQAFVNQLTQLQGGNYIFAQNGQDMIEYFKQFDTLVNPLAYDFKADLTFETQKYKLVRIHGIPEVSSEKPLDSVIGIETLFLVRTKEKGGGAVVVEFDVLN